MLNRPKPSSFRRLLLNFTLDQAFIFFSMICPCLWKMFATPMHPTGFSSEAAVPHSKFTELFSSAAVVSQSKSTELCSSAAPSDHDL